MFELKTFYANLNITDREVVLQCFFDMYYNTDQSAKDYGQEFYYLTAEILKGRLPIKLKYLADNFIEILIERLPHLKEYYKPFLEEGEDYE